MRALRTDFRLAVGRRADERASVPDRGERAVLSVEELAYEVGGVRVPTGSRCPWRAGSWSA